MAWKAVFRSLLYCLIFPHTDKYVLNHQVSKRKFITNYPCTYHCLHSIFFCYFSCIFAEGKTNNNDLLTWPVLCISVILKSMLFIYHAVIYISLLI